MRSFSGGWKGGRMTGLSIELFWACCWGVWTCLLLCLLCLVLPVLRLPTSAPNSGKRREERKGEGGTGLYVCGWMERLYVAVLLSLPLCSELTTYAAFFTQALALATAREI